MLLGVEQELANVNDDTVEGATVLMTKIGQIIDTKLATIEENIQKG